MLYYPTPACAGRACTAPAPAAAKHRAPADVDRRGGAERRRVPAEPPSSSCRSPAPTWRRSKTPIYEAARRRSRASRDRHSRAARHADPLGRRRQDSPHVHQARSAGSRCTPSIPNARLVYYYAHMDHYNDAMSPGRDDRARRHARLRRHDGQRAEGHAASALSGDALAGRRQILERRADQSVRRARRRRTRRARAAAADRATGSSRDV